jgi:hypothetical protein
MRLVSLLGLVGSLFAQESPEQLGSLILERFRIGTPEDFAAVYPFPQGRAMHAEAVKRKIPRVAGLARVIAQRDTEAVLLLSAHGLTINAGDSVWMAAELAGLHRAVKEGSQWKLAERWPIDHGNRILAHDLDVTVIPNHGLAVTDRITTQVRNDYGWAAYLNSNARIKNIAVNGKPARHEFGASLLWIEVSRASQAELRIEYDLAIEEGPDNNNSGCFLKRAGHVRNQYAWHPFFWFGNPNGDGAFRITARIPTPYHLATSLEQTEMLEGDTRVVRGASVRNTPALTLTYDRDWKPQRVIAGRTTLEVFSTPDFEPSPAEIAAEFQRSYDLLKKRFGAPPGGYFAVVQGRSRSGGGWHNIANQAVFAGFQGGPFYSAEPVPRANFFHEVAHAWTAGAAPADHFLTEGWATFAESIFLREKLGEKVARRFWEFQAKSYFDQHDGKAALLRDPGNGGVAYSKGAWIFRMLEECLGREKFASAISQFSRASLNQPATVAEFIALFERVQPGTAEFVTPFIEQTSAPNITARVEGSRVMLEQNGPLFALPLEIEIQTGAEHRRQLVALRARTARLDDVGIIKSVILDPDWKLLMNPKSRLPFQQNSPPSR